MNQTVAVALLVVACYLIGGIPFGYLVGRLKGVDIRSVGSGNIGATNVGRTLGRKWGILCFVLDVLKGLGPTIAAGWLLQERAADWELSSTGQNLLWLGAGICCVLGHNYPVYLRFRGGKGVATSLGVVLGVYPYLTVAGLLTFVIWAAVTLTTRYVSLGSVCAAGALPILLVAVTLSRGRMVFQENLALVGFSVIAASLVVYRHRANIARLRAGTESRIGSGR